jgi:putative Mg2+ transporter-C (MgtC) family protein
MPVIDNHEFYLRLLLAVVFGGLIGLEREKHGRAAGFRTNILVCVSATLVMMCSQQIYTLFGDLSGVQSVARVDPGRIANGIIMGIGFLGAGAIVRHENITRGLTTAACLWLVTGVGIALGMGFYLWASVTTGLALIVLLPLKKLERIFAADNYGTLTVAGDAAALACESVDRVLNTFTVRVQHYGVKQDNASGEKSLVFNVKFAGHLDAEKMIRELTALPGVRTAEWK